MESKKKACYKLKSRGQEGARRRGQEGARRREGGHGYKDGAAKVAMVVMIGLQGHHEELDMTLRSQNDPNMELKSSAK